MVARESRQRDGKFLAWHAFVTLSSSVAIQILSVGTGIITARALGPGGKGMLTAVLLWPALLVSVGGFGINDAVAFFTARSPHRAADVAATGMIVAALQGATLCTLGLLLTPVLIGHYGQDAVEASRLYLVWIPLNLVTQTAMSALQGRQRFWGFNGVRVMVVITTLIGLLLLMVVHSITLTAVVQIYLAANAVAMVMALSMLGPTLWSRVFADLSLVMPMLKYGLKSHTGNLSSFANERADQALISVFLAPSYLGLYAVAGTVASPLGLIGGSLGYIVMPAVSAATDEAERRAILARFVRVCVLVSAVTAGVGFVFAPGLIRLFFGSAFASAADSTRVLLVAGVALATNRVVSAGVKALGRPLLAGGGELVATAATVVGLALLLPSLGIVGASIASLTAYSTSLVFMVWQLKKRHGFTVASLLIPHRSDWKRIGPHRADRSEPAIREA